MKKLYGKEVTLILAGLLVLIITIGCTPTTPLTTETPEPTDQEQPETPSESEPTTTQPVTEEEPSQIVAVTESEWKITLDKKEIKAGKVKFIITNDGPRFPHALRIVNTATGKGVGDQASVNQDEVDSLVVTLTPGTYEIYCPLSGHKEKGMKTTLKVK